MNLQLTELAFILDRSGSMGSMADAAIEGFNAFLREQQQAPGHARLTLVLFDDEYLTPEQSTPVENVTPLDRTTYVPRNSTALLDTIARTTDELGARLADIPEAERPGTVIVTVLTDGLENASTRETWDSVSRRIHHQTEKYGWQFLFLGANQDAIATAAQLRISALNAATYQADSIGHRATSAAIAKKLKALRARAAGVATAEDCLYAADPMEVLLAREDRKLCTGEKQDAE